MSFKHAIADLAKRQKNRDRVNFYLTPFDFVVAKDFIVSSDGLSIYGGYFDIPRGSNFYTEICVDNLVDVTDPKEVVDYLKSKSGFYKCKEQYNRQFIAPAKKYLKRYKVYDSEILINLVKLKVNSKDKFMKFVNQIKDKSFITKTSILLMK